MKNFIDKFKDMDKNSKWMIILSIIVIIILIINISINVGYVIDYNNSRKSGDDKWKMFAGMMEEYDRRIHDVEGRMNFIEGIVNEDK